MDSENLIDPNRGPDGPDPIFRGTNIRLFEVLKQRGKGLSDSQLLVCFPGLNEERIGAATEYVENIRKSALSGDYNDQMLMAMFLESGIGVAQDLGQAAIFLQLSAEAGNASSQYLYAVRLGGGAFGAIEKSQALRWHRIAASNGHMISQCEVGAAYHFGDGVPKNPPEAARWFLRSANQGYPVAQAYLAVLYLLGEGVPQDRVLAYKWANLACAGGFRKAIEVRDLVASEFPAPELEMAQRLCREWSAVEEI